MIFYSEDISGIGNPQREAYLMKRSAGVTIVASILLTFSALGLLFTIVGLIAMLWASIAEPRNDFSRPILAILFLGLAFCLFVYGLGVFTGIGLWRLKNWARITTIVLAVLMILQSLIFFLDVLLFSVIPPPTEMNASPHFRVFMRVEMAGIGLLFLGVGVWWIVLFTRRRVRAQFQSVPSSIAVEIEQPAEDMVPVPAPKAGRVPVVVLVVAVLLLAATPSLLFALFLPFPAPLMGKILYGVAGKLVYVAIGLIDLTLGIGLLRLKRWSLPATIAFYIFSILNSLFMFFPSARDAYLTALSRLLPFSLPPDLNPFPPRVFALLIDFGLVFGVLFSGALIVLLIRSRPAFEQAARERAAATS